MASTAPLIQCRICGQHTPISPGSKIPPERCLRCGAPFQSALDLGANVPPVPTHSAATTPSPHARSVETARALILAAAWGLAGAVIGGAVLAVGFAILAVSLGDNVQSFSLFGLDIGFLAGGFSVATWKAVRLLDLEAVGGAAVGAFLGLCTAGLHVVVERTLLHAPEPTAHIAVPMGVVAGLVFGGFIGYWNEE